MLSTQLLTEKYPAAYSDSLFRAVLGGDTDIVRSLIGRGADVNITDTRGWTPLDYAVKRNRREIRTILLENGARTFTKNIPDMVEGPHIRVIDSLRFEMAVLKHDNETGNSSIERDTVWTRELPYNMGGILIEQEDLDLDADNAPVKSSWSDIRKIFVVGDIHGEYDRVADLLKNNRIIDRRGNWNWGRGHLVFMGDIFDRGSKVTEAYWMIFKLAKQAEKAGGMVHMILGNHEPMIFNGDLRYLTDDYYSLCDNLGLSYPSLFSEKTLLGHWIRQMPVMLQINQYTFIHGGISPELYNAQLPADTLNKIVRQYLNKSESERNTDTRSLILGNDGILWYRGMADDGSRSKIIDDLTLKGALEFYSTDAFVIGHTEVDSITTFFDKRVIDVNIPKGDDDIEEQGLLIRGRKVLVVYNSGRRRAL
ncbi:MAG: metallophosphoesterase [Bacteroidales bacterium]|nr:metallophosphoesterase [Bacteroidales bacterium]